MGVAAETPLVLAVYYWFCGPCSASASGAACGGERRFWQAVWPCFSCIFFLFLWEKHLYRRNSRADVIKKAEIEGNTLCLSDGTRIDLRQVRKVRRKEEQVWIFLKEHRFLWLDMTEWPWRRNRICLDLS